jgi:integrase
MGTIEAYTVEAGKRYRVIYRKPDHRQTSKRGFTTKRDAELFLSTIEVAKARGEFVDASVARAKIADLGADWLRNQTHVKPSSLRPVEIAWRVYVEPVWGSRAVGEIRHSEVQQWVSKIATEGKGRSATAVLRAYGVLAGILDVAVRDRRILVNPARGVNLPRRTHKEHRYLSRAEVRALAKNAGKHGLLVSVFAYTGLRWGEAIALRVSDVDLNRRRFNISHNAVEVGGEVEFGTPKSHKRRAVPFPRFLEQEIKDACAGKDPEALLFSDEFGNHMRRTRVSGGSRSWFKSALSLTGLEPMTIHDLRHTAASLAISSGANVKAVQRMLGHASAAMTLDIYADLFDDDLDAVAQALDQARIASDVAELLPDAEAIRPTTAKKR